MNNDIRKWFYYPIVIPVTCNGDGPAVVGEDAEHLTFDVWDQLCCSHGTYDNLLDAVNEAMRLERIRNEST